MSDSDLPGEQFTFSKGPSDKQTAGKYVVTNQSDLLLVHLTDTTIASANEKAEQNKKPVAFFRAPAPIYTLQCASDKIVESGLTRNFFWQKSISTAVPISAFASASVLHSSAFGGSVVGVVGPL